MKIHVSIIDDHPLIRKGIKHILSTVEEIEIINEFDNGEEFINKIKNNPDEDPHIIILDYQMPKMDGLEVCKWLKVNKPLIKPIVISSFNESSTVKRFIHNGAFAYLLKSSLPETITEAITTVSNNQIFLNNQITKELTRPYYHYENRKELEITKREKEVLMLICKELTYKEIAEELNISSRTVEEHKNNLLRKIGSSKVTGIVVYASKQGWI